MLNIIFINVHNYAGIIPLLSTLLLLYSFYIAIMQCGFVNSNIACIFMNAINHTYIDEQVNYQRRQKNSFVDTKSRIGQFNLT